MNSREILHYDNTYDHFQVGGTGQANVSQAGAAALDMGIAFPPPISKRLPVNQASSASPTGAASRPVEVRDASSGLDAFVADVDEAGDVGAVVIHWALTKYETIHGTLALMFGVVVVSLETDPTRRLSADIVRTDSPLL